MIRLSKWLYGNASPIVIGAALISFFFPSLFSWVSGQTQTVVLGIIMLSMGLTLTPEDFKNLATRPLDICIGTLAQFTVMPLVAYLLWHTFGLPPALAVGIMLVGCCPGGVSSNIMSFLCHGDVAFSVGMTTVSTLLAPVVTPLLMLWLAGQTVEVDAIGMFINILIVTLIPVGAGFGLNVWLGHKPSFKTIQQIMPGVGVLALACIVGGVISVVQADIVKGGIGLFFLTFATVLCHTTLGYILGYAAGKLSKFSKAKNRTISIEVGMQNAGLATNLATNFFIATMPLAVVPCAISCVWHSISGTLLAGWFAKNDSKHEKQQ